MLSKDQEPTLTTAMAIIIIMEEEEA